MKKLLCITLLFLVSSFGSAETANLTVEGMHCGGCKKMISKKVCDDAALAKGFESCQVELIDAKKQIGMITIKAKNNSSVDVVAVEQALRGAGEDYKLTKKEIKK